MSKLRVFACAFSFLAVPSCFIAACSGGSGFSASLPDASIGPESDDSGIGSVVVPSGQGVDASDSSAASASDDASGGLTQDASDTTDLSCDGGLVPNDSNNCGACGSVCAAPDGGSAACVQTDGGYSCQITCSAGYTYCSSCVDTQTDSKNCGSCGHDCLGGGCGAGQCQQWPLVKTTDQADVLTRTGFRTWLATDGTNVVWFDGNQGILEVPVLGTVPGGAIKTLAPMPMQSSIFALTMANHRIAWTNSDGHGGISVWTVPEDGSEAASLGGSVATDGGNLAARGLALDATGDNAYFLTDPGSGSGALYQCTIATQSCTALATAFASGNQGNDVAVSGSNVFWTDSVNGNVWRADTKRVSPTIRVAMGQVNPYKLAVDPLFVYWANYDAESRLAAIDRTAQTGASAIEPVVSGASGYIGGMADDGVHVYFDTQSTAGFEDSPVDGSAAPQAFPANAVGISRGSAGIAVGGGVVAWVDETEYLRAIVYP